MVHTKPKNPNYVQIKLHYEIKDAQFPNCSTIRYDFRHFKFTEPSEAKAFWDKVLPIIEKMSKDFASNEN